MNGPRLRWPNYIGTAAIEHSPHNNEINDVEAEADRRALSKQKKRFLSKTAYRADFEWETSAWTALHSFSLKSEPWIRRIEPRSGQRTFALVADKLEIVCDATATAITLRRGEQGEMTFLIVGRVVHSPEGKAVLMQMASDELKRIRALETQKNA